MTIDVRKAPHPSANDDEDSGRGLSGVRVVPLPDFPRPTAAQVDAALRACGAWRDLDWVEVLDSLEQIRRGSVAARDLDVP